MEKGNQGLWDVNMIADYCWSLKRKKGIQKGIKRKRQPPFRSFHGEFYAGYSVFKILFTLLIKVLILNVLI